MAMVFGKMPAHGDFVSLGWEPGETDAWDAWISREMLDQRTMLGAAFEERFDQAPVWRFSVPRGEARLAGAMAPSQDSVGRRFMLIAARESDVADDALPAACEDLIYDALSEGWTAPQLQAALAAHPVGEGAHAPADWWTCGNDLFPEASRAGAHPDSLIALMLTPRAEAV